MGDNIKMDISKYKKPIHYVCPKCGADMTFNGYELVKRKQSLAKEAEVIKTKMRNHENEFGKKDAYYGKLVKELKDTTNRLIEAKNEVSMASDIANREVFEVFKQLVKAEVGAEKFAKLIIEAEETVSYSDKDLAKQKFTNYQDIG